MTSAVQDPFISLGRRGRSQAVIMSLIPRLHPDGTPEYRFFMVPDHESVPDRPG